MIDPNHIKDIHQQLLNIGSKVPDSCLDDNPHVLRNILRLACGGGTYKVSDSKAIENIKTNQFNIKYDCQSLIIRGI